MRVETVSSYDVREKWTAMVEQINRDKGAYVVERYRRPVAAIIDFELLLQIEEMLGIKLEYTTAKSADADVN
jgi:PHD/YefM family antitoxin component YafN of YafNO toxin-antitoxin module